MEGTLSGIFMPHPSLAHRKEENAGLQRDQELVGRKGAPRAEGVGTPLHFRLVLSLELALAAFWLHVATPAIPCEDTALQPG